MTWLEALLLGIVQGFTEFLPVSSSGHLEIGTVLLGIQNHDHLLFAVILHAATALSTIVVFRNDIIALLTDLLKFQWDDSWQFAIKIGISLVPVMIVGLFFKDEIESFFTGNLLLVGAMLLITALLLYISQLPRSNSGDVSFFGSFIIGVAQAVAILPGISRSGATIATGLMLGFDREKVTRFSFLMVLIPILGASLLELKDYIEEVESTPAIAVETLIIGFMASFVSGYIACSWMISLVKKGKLKYFAIYCAIVGLIAIIASL